CASPTATWRPCAGSTCACGAARSSRSWVRTGPARPPPSRSSRATASARPGRFGSSATTRRVGIVLQSTGIDPYLTVRETVELYARYFPHPRDVDEVIDLVGLTDKRDARVIALAGDPELLFLDEPTTGFDPGARRNAWEIVRNLASLGKTVFLTTHYMDEA